MEVEMEKESIKSYWNRLKAKVIELKNDNKNFNKIMISIGAVAIAFASFAIVDNVTKAYSVSIGDNVVGVVREKEEALTAYDEVKKELEDTYDAKIELDDEITFKKTNVFGDKDTDKETLEKNIKKQINFKVDGYALVIEGETIGVFKDSAEIENILEAIKKPYTDTKDRKSTLKEVKFLENIDIQKVKANISDISDTEEILQKIKDGKEAKKTHTVEIGESLWTISMMYDTDVEKLIAANPDVVPEDLKPGDEVNLIVPQPLLTVVTVEEVEYTKELDYEVTVKEDESMYNTQKKIITKGTKGEAEVTANEIRHNGVLVEKKVVNEVVVTKPRTEVVAKGTKEPPKTMATGTFMMPTRGRLSSPYGNRGARMHLGVDIANSVGTSIYAADGGKVVFTGYQGSYGYMIEIDHENGYTTRYAHLSKILVSSGTRVYKGQLIGKMGSTGNSTGPHLHFEVLKNGVNKNPASYIY
ncbi:LysM peptidoglycan-binding domain-containing protein [Soehngenia saccharolytica]|nr:LysM peptidoglycan-binding domain-containing protein [Soehngenia saccharolytica]